MKIIKENFGKTSRGEKVSRYTLENAGGTAVKLLDYGCTIQSFTYRGRDIALGYDSIEEYETCDGYLGAVVGRHANRIGGACFSLGGREFALAKNDGENHLHGGERGFDRYVWEAREEGGALCFGRISPDGEEGYPGKLRVQVKYSLGDDDALRIVYMAESDADTVINLTNHCYFNLNGHDSGSAAGHLLQLNAECFTGNSEQCLPTGEILSVEGTPFDFRSPKPIDRDIDKACSQLINCGGYDHNFVLSGEGLRRIGRLEGDKSCISMSVFTDQPGVQLYTANFLTPRKGKGGAEYGRRHAVCLETQHFPNAMRHGHFPSVVLKKEEIFYSETVYKLSCGAEK